MDKISYAAPRGAGTKTYLEFSPRHWGGLAFESTRTAQLREWNRQAGLTLMMRGWFL